MAALSTRPDLQVSDPGVVIRKAGVRDLPLVYAFELAYIREVEPAAEAVWRDALQPQLEHWIACLPHMFVAERHGEVVGECFWQTGEGGALLASLCVAPAARRRGVGRLLLEAFERDAAAAGFSRLALGVFRGNPARAFYVAEGYVATRTDGVYEYFQKTTGAQAREAGG
jgi:[ribosomal protein S18]-alanine N-acetyltransferase